MAKKRYQVYVPIRKFRVVEVWADTEAEAMMKVDAGGEGTDTHVVDLKVGPNGKFELQAVEIPGATPDYGD